MDIHKKWLPIKNYIMAQFPVMNYVRSHDERCIAMEQEYRGGGLTERRNRFITDIIGTN